MGKLIVDSPEKWRIEGELDFTTVERLLSQFEQQARLPKTLDLEAVTRTDSAGLALLIELRRRTQTQPIHFENIPAQMLSIAKISGVEDIVLRS